MDIDTALNFPCSSKPLTLSIPCLSENLSENLVTVVSLFHEVSDYVRFLYPSKR